MQTDMKRSWLNRPIIPSLPAVTLEVILFLAILLVAVITRFYDLGTRVMSHDESLHTYYSWLLSRGLGYQHNPMMHGTLQFHLVALSYFLFGASDFTARIPAVLFNLATIALVWKWRRYLGNTGAILTALFFVISPYFLYYGRYVRNEAFVGFFGLLMLYAVLRYLEDGKNIHLYLLSASLVLHFTAKETAFIYAAQLLLFLAILFISRITSRKWHKPAFYNYFILTSSAAILFLGAALGYGLFSGQQGVITATETAPVAIPGEALPAAPAGGLSTPAIILGAVGVILLILAAVLVFRGFLLMRIRQERSFDLLMLVGTLVLPQLTAFPVKLAGFNPLDYTNQGLVRTGFFLVPILVLSAAIGIWWNRELWIKNALLFYAIFVIFFTTIFTNGNGFFSGIIGSLGYWIEQQAVKRGSQPWYYYILIQIPIYEFLPALGSIAALLIGLRRKESRFLYADESEDTDDSPQQASGHPIIPESAFLVFSGWWLISSILAFSIAGEKMPWLTFHMAIPMFLLSGWAIGKLVESVDWKALSEKRLPLVTLLVSVFVISLLMTTWNVLTSPPFQGKDLVNLQATNSFIFSLVVTVGSGWGLRRLLQGWDFSQIFRLAALFFFAILGVLTIRASFLASYINYDNAKEYLVYAHSFTGVKDVMRQVEEVSERINGGTSAPVAYDDDVAWPFSWYLRDFTNQRYYQNQPTRDLRDLPLIIVGDNNFVAIEPVVGQGFYRFDYIRMVWPNQDYFGLTRERVINAIQNPDIRAGIFDIWLNRDFKKYAQATGSTSTELTTWSPSDRMRLYVRKDIAAQIWNFGVSPSAPVVADPYEGNVIELAADMVMGNLGSGEGQFNSPRGLAFAADRSFYVADSKNHRIQHFSASGTLIHNWGTFMDAALQSAAPGTFNEPWGVAVGPDGSVFVTDTWNHRIQKFSSSGQPLMVWGNFGLADQPDAFWGPRGIAVDESGRVYVADTGNKRIAIFDSNGGFITQFGTTGVLPGQFDEPVGVAIDSQGLVYVTDTWNQRVQVFIPDGSNLIYSPLLNWEIAGWYGKSLDNKPFITVTENGVVFVTDPESSRVLEFTREGKFIKTWGSFGTGPDGIGIASGIAVDKQGKIWVSDSGNHRILRYSLP